jgi:hypothetical protein
MTTAEERIRALEVDVGVLKAFVPKVEALDDKLDRVFSFIDKHEEQEKRRDETDKRRARIHFALLAGLISLVVGIGVELFALIIDGKHVIG